jgi:hypothetical protein
VSVRVRLTRNGPRQVRKQAGVLADLERRAHAVNQASGGGMEVDARRGRGRARATVAAVTEESRRAEATGRVLTRAVDAGRQ